MQRVDIEATPYHCRMSSLQTWWKRVMPEIHLSIFVSMAQRRGHKNLFCHFYFFCHRPTLSAIKSNRANDGMVDLRLQMVTGLPIAREAGCCALFQPGSVDSRRDFMVQTSINCER